MGSFRPGAGNQHLHWYFNFTGCLVETVLKSLRLSCGSELPRQGISPVSYTHLLIILDSSMVEHSAVNRVVGGSSPTRGVISVSYTHLVRR